MGLDFDVTPDVLVPNPDTEVLVQRAVAIARESSDPVRVADVGTGTGCIAIAVARYAPSTEVWATDISAEALAVAQRNVAKYNLSGRVHLACGDLMAPLAGEFDLICANLPYVDAATPLPAEVMAQPARALYAEGGGAALVQRLLAEAPSRLKPGGRILAEIDPAIASSVGATAGNHQVHRDLGGHARVLEAWF
jgi:release factor glutamine methyltransferase